ncbi:amino acid oxidase [Jeotgalibacillus malaysiensis]|uniref:Amino acid oxidase n=1 Tax=Jeotgalibacillus malaysiensis TaxID=1508404 RepID=A0A0B5AHJ1_9BACL|nr:hypothetical protein [Jeotgalibacillus malaysiensis]AJD89546.1 amino acid oxidase [Jeotgalibacillus malaysiensis]
MKRIIFIVSLWSLFLLGACSNEEVKYDGAFLRIAVVGDIPELISEKIYFESISLSEFSEKKMENSTDFDAVMITPVMFEKASNDDLVQVYNSSELPFIFFDSTKRHFPFIREGVTYETADWGSLDNGSHTTIYLSNVDGSREDAWHFYLKDEKELNKLYKEIFQKVETL